MAEGRGVSACVGCIFTVAFGSGGLAPSGGRVMRAVSFFGAALFCVTGSGADAPPGAPGPGLSGTVGRAPSDGGFGGAAPSGFGAIGGPGGFGGGTNGLAASPGAPAPPPTGNFVVSFFGAVPTGGSGLPGTLIRTVSRFTAG